MLSITTSSTRIIRLTLSLLLILGLLSCKKDHQEQKGMLRTIRYTVSGTNFRLNYIDANSVFHEGELHSGSFEYEFRKGSGARVGISIFKQADTDTIFEWNIFVDGGLVANAHGEGGAYFDVAF